MSELVEILSANVETRQGKKGAYYKQTGYVTMVSNDGVPDAYPSKIQFMVFKDVNGSPEAYPVGHYRIHPSSFRVGQYGDLEIGFLRLHPIKVDSSKK